MAARHWLYVVPAAVFATLAGLLYWGLFQDPSEVPTVMAGRTLPAFDLPPVDGATPGLASSDVKTGEISVINVFASWCVPCRAEHPQLTEIAALEGVRLYGIDYKDTPADARAFLDDLGDPYARIGADADGRVGIDLGVYGVPETYFVGRDGLIHYKHIGPIAPEHMTKRIRPLIERLKQ